MGKSIVLGGVVVISLIVLALGLVRRHDQNVQQSTWNTLSQTKNYNRQCFNTELLAGLPDTARRYFEFSIKPGSALYFVSEIHMQGEISLGTRDNPNYLPMRAEQILAPPFGLVWKLSAGKGLIRFSGSDGIDDNHSWTRFWLWGLLPVARAGENENHRRSAFGRVVAESVFWAPAALLPQNGVTWLELDKNTARASIVFGNTEQTVDITVADNGMPTKVVIPRWSDANPQKTFQLQPFGGYLSEFQEFSGYRLPTVVEGGNFIDTDDYFPFYKVRVVELNFIDSNNGDLNCKV